MEAHVSVDRQILAKVQEEIQELFLRMEYRPQVVVILQDKEEGEVLFVQAVNNFWGLPQGGVNKGEDILTALIRELLEETGIDRTAFVIRKLCHVDQLDIPQGRDGFTKGKRYYHFHCVCKVKPRIILQRSELLGYRWVDPASAQMLLAGIGEEKRQSIISALRHVGFIGCSSW